MSEPIKLNLGCGTDYRVGFVNIDDNSQGKFKVDVEANVHTLEYEPETVSHILVIHLICYFTPPELDEALRRWYQWLIPGGQLQIESGNIYSVCKHILKAKTINELHGKQCIRQLYGWESSHGHKWAWAPITVKDAMEQVGFKEIGLAKGYYHHNPERDFVINGKKL
jgi:ubiquinone/menaquinone biosynthesis C-methylase UbiE